MIIELITLPVCRELFTVTEEMVLVIAVHHLLLGWFE